MVCCAPPPLRWGVAGNLVWAWILTIPACALAAAQAGWLRDFVF